MLYALSITIAAGLVLLALFGGGILLARRLVTDGAPAISLRGWRWYPSPLGLLLIPLAALVLWRVFPELLFVPFILPFVFRRVRGLRNPFTARRRRGERDAFEGESRRRDDP